MDVTDSCFKFSVDSCCSRMRFKFFYKTDSSLICPTLTPVWFFNLSFLFQFSLTYSTAKPQRTVTHSSNLAHLVTALGCCHTIPSVWDALSSVLIHFSSLNSNASSFKIFLQLLHGMNYIKSWISQCFVHISFMTVLLKTQILLTFVSLGLAQSLAQGRCPVNLCANINLTSDSGQLWNLLW